MPGPGEWCLFLGGACSKGVPSPGVPAPGVGCLLPGVVPGPRGCLVERSPRTATAVGGTHPTGMHSCSIFQRSQQIVGYVTAVKVFITKQRISCPFSVKLDGIENVGIFIT